MPPFTPHGIGDRMPAPRPAGIRHRAFERDLANRLGCVNDADPAATFLGSGDFHHVSLALLRRLTRPFNLLILDKHPDWMRRIPLMHCGTWLNHAARLPLARHVFHIGGDLDFDNAYRWLAPWDLLRRRRIIVLPAVRSLSCWQPLGRLSKHEAAPVPDSDCTVTPERLEELLSPHRDELARWPLYISVDKDVLRPADAVVNWDSGHLELNEATTVLEAFRYAAGDDLAGMDLVGDWSPVEVQGIFRRLLHWTEHPLLRVDADEACWRNERTNSGPPRRPRRGGFGAFFCDFSPAALPGRTICRLRLRRNRAKPQACDERIDGH